MKTWLIIDGYNLIFQLPTGMPNLPPDLAGKRHFLLRMLDEMAGILAGRVTVVFDGRTAPPVDAEQYARMNIIFSPSDKTADTVIEQMVCRAEHPGDITVVTSDRRENENIRAAGANVISCAMFLDHWKQERERLEWTITRRANRAPAASLGDFFPKKQSQ